jgi:hypothetical protein
MRQVKTFLLVLFGVLFCFTANSLAAPAQSRAYFTKYNTAFSNTAFTTVAQLHLPAGTYLIYADANAQANGTAAANMNFGCGLFHTDPTKLPNLLDPNQHPVVFAPLAPNGGTLLFASGHTEETATFTTSSADVIFWLCQDTSGISMTAAGTLRAIRYKAITTQ